MKIFIHYHNDWAVSYYRCKLPFYNCYNTLAAEGVELILSNDLMEAESNYDAYIFNGMPSDHVLFFSKKLREKGRKIVWHLDDNHFVPPNNNLPDYDERIRLKLIADLADRIWVSTPFLASQINKYCENAKDKLRVLPLLVNAVSFEQEISYGERLQLADNPIRILWAGSMFHTNDLELLVDSVKQIIDEYQDSVRFIFWGDIPDAFITWKRRTLGDIYANLEVSPQYQPFIVFKTGLAFRFYHSELAKLQPHIGLAPLCTDDFSKAKSNLKYIEYSLVGAATIASNLEPYHCLKHNKTGLLVPSNVPSAWYHAIKSLIDDSLRRKLYANNAKLDCSQYQWTHARKPTANAKLWLTAFRELV